VVLPGLEKKRICSEIDRKPADWWVVWASRLFCTGLFLKPADGPLKLDYQRCTKVGDIESVGAVDQGCGSLPVDLSLSLRLRPVCCPGQIREFVVVENLCTAPKPKQT
jgi:hypothetical protein